VRLPTQFSPLEAALSTHFASVLTPGQRRDLAAWVAGTLLAGSSCLTLVVTALVDAVGAGRWDRVRQALKEWLLAGAERSAPGRVQVDPAACFAPLLGWVLSLWRSPQLALAVDVTTHQDRLTAIVISVLYRGRAIPVAWHLLPGNVPGAYLPPLLRLLALLAPQTRGLRLVTLAADRGLWSPLLYERTCQWGWHPLSRVQRDVWVWLGGGRHVRAAALVPGPGHAWVGRAVVHKHAPARRRLTVLVVWALGYAEPWVVFSDLPPAQVGVAWYALRTWIEQGFRDLKRLGWQWERTRRTDPTRVARHWLVLAIATLWALATGTLADAAARQRADQSLRPRPVSTFQRGRLRWLGWVAGWRALPTLALLPEPWPDQTHFPGLQVHYAHDPADPDHPVNLPL
jgi:hypothetical protein